MTASTHEERRRQYRADARQSILDAAERLLMDHGADGFSMRQLGSACGCTAATLYHYFRDKPGLISQVLDARLEKLVCELEAIAPGEEPVVGVREIAKAFTLFAQRNPGHYQLLVEQVRDNVSETPARERLVRVFSDAMQPLVDDDRLLETDVEVLRQGVWSLLHGFILLQATLPDDEWEPDLLDRSLDALIRGFATANRSRSNE